MWLSIKNSIYYSCHPSAEKKKAIWEAITANWWHIIYNWNAKRSTRKCKYKYCRSYYYEGSCRRNESCTSTYVRFFAFLQLLIISCLTLCSIVPVEGTSFSLQFLYFLHIIWLILLIANNWFILLELFILIFGIVVFLHIYLVPLCFEDISILY